MIARDGKNQSPEKALIDARAADAADNSFERDRR